MGGKEERERVRDCGKQRDTVHYGVGCGGRKNDE